MVRGLITLLFMLVAICSFTSVVAQTIIVGQNNPSIDIQAVQTAVSQGGSVLLKGNFDFGTEGRVNITKDVKIEGEKDNKGAPTTKIKGGFWSFHSPLSAQLPPTISGPKITIQSIHFDGALWSPICLAYCSGATISNNQITNVRPKAMGEKLIFGKPGLNIQQGIICYPGYGQTWETRKYIPNVFTGNLIIEDNDVDLINEDPTKTMAQGVIIIWTTGITAQIQRNTIINCSRNSIETIDNYLGEDGSGMVLIKDNKITTSQVGLPVPTPGTPNGIVAGWFLDQTGGSDPKRNLKHTITNNSIKARGQRSAGIAAFTDGVVIEGNAVATEAPGAISLFLASGNGFIAHNKIEGTGIHGLMAMPWGPLKASNNLFIGNNFTQFKASVADVIFQKEANNNLLLGGSGTVTNLGSGNQITGLKPISK
jgi:hypothetical protein